jgi:hypothetical protein
MSTTQSMHTHSAGDVDFYKSLSLEEISQELDSAQSELRALRKRKFKRPNRVQRSCDTCVRQRIRCNYGRNSEEACTTCITKGISRSCGIADPKRRPPRPAGSCDYAADTVVHRIDNSSSNAGQGTMKSVIYFLITD